MKSKINWLEIVFGYDIAYGFKNLWDYLPLIWATRDWDYAYLYELVIFKMKRMQKNFIGNQILYEDKITAHQIKTAYMALERVTKDEYPGFKKYLKISKAKRKVFPIKNFIKDERLLQKDLTLFTDYFNRYSRGWWH
jgi:hypothetical protein